MIQQTSLTAFRSLDLGSRQREVFDGFVRFGDCTNLELSISLGLPINQVTPRTNELVKSGAVLNKGKRRCGVSGRTVIAWGVM